MITVQEAKNLIAANCSSAKTEILDLEKAVGCILAVPVYAPVDTPPFNQSAMDGYAFSFSLWDGKSSLRIIGEIQAGTYLGREVQVGETIRIYTGSAMPPGADTVIMQEKIIAREGFISLQDETLCKGNNVRIQGSQTKTGGLMLCAGHYLSAASISFLAGTGINKVSVFAKPTVSIIVTGKELVKPGELLGSGFIYESNSYGLTAALQQLGISPESTLITDDEMDKIIDAIKSRLHSNILIITGGVSVGNYDFVAGALELCGVKKIFHKVKQKPGKPFYFGIKNDTLVFALPGNPAAVLTCFYEYVVPAIGSFTRKEYFKKSMLPLANEYSKKKGLYSFLKGKTNANEVVILENQESYQMNSFAMADCLIELEEGKEHFTKGEPVPVLFIS